MTKHVPEYQASRKPLNFHYAWVILTCSMILIVLSAIVRQSFGVFVDPLVEAYGWSRGAVSLAYSVAFVCAAVSSIALGPFCERIGTRRTLLLCVASFCAGVILLGTANALWQLYLYYGVLCGGLGFLMNIVIPVALTRWFARGAGVALGFMWASIGIGGLLGPVALRWFITNTGWRDTFFLVGASFGGIMLLTAYFIRSRPQDMNVRAYGEQEPVLTPVNGMAAIPTPSLAPGIEFDHIKRSPAFWHLTNTHFLGCVGHAILLAHIVSIAILRGIPELKAAGVLGIISATSTVSRFGFPILVEKLGAKRTLALAFVMQAVPIPFLFLVADPWEFYIVAFFFGLGMGGEMPCFPIINRQYWGPLSPLNVIYAWEMAGALIGMAMGGWLGGILYDITGTYSVSIVTAFLFTIAGLAPILALPRHRPGVILAESPAIKTDDLGATLDI
jgi:MFS family permease